MDKRKKGFLILLSIILIILSIMGIKNYRINNYSSKYLQKVADIISAVLMDHPELIQVGLVTLQIQNGSEMVIISPSYVISKEDYQDKINEIKIIIEQVKQQTKNLNEFEKVKYVYDYIGKTNR